MRINARRGAVTTPARLPRSFLDCLIPAFVYAQAVIILIGYYYFFFSSSGVTVSGSESGSGTDANGVGGHGGAKATIGYAVTVTGCPKHDNSRGDFGAGITDGAAVLKHSVHTNSIRGGGDGSANKSKYDYQMYALVHPEAEECGRTLEPLGYKVLIRDDPVPLSEIEGDYLREKVPKNGCCGEKEFVKLHAFALTDHPAVVHLDLDTLVLQPMDALFDVMIDGPPIDRSNGGVAVAFDDPLIAGGQVDAFFTRDYNMAHRGMKHPGVQGGFLVLRPSVEVYEEFVSIVRKGDFRSNGGWGGLGFGPFYGSMTFQGIIPYFYDHLHPGKGVELNHCIYNNMADNPRDKPTKNDIVDGSCRDGFNRPDKNDQCEDCRSRPFDEVVTTHFTLCQKPWMCLPQSQDRIQERLCRKLHAEWFRIREDLETTVWGRDKDTGSYDPDHFRGYCKKHGGDGYIRVKLPGGKE